jgi:hypothetical protein
MKSNHLPWQIEMFRRSIKKQQKLRAPLAWLGETRDKTYLHIMCGDNNGALKMRDFWRTKSNGDLA